MNTNRSIRSILYATDFSAQSEAAYPLAVALARDYGARLIIAHVTPTPEAAYMTGQLAMFNPEGIAAIDNCLQEFDPKDPNIEVEFMVVEGDAANEIVGMARTLSCDLIVIGTHGRSGVTRLVAGSVAEQVMRQAPCPVLTVRCPTTSATPTRQVQTAAAS